jgi:hypothetical protein
MQTNLPSDLAAVRATEVQSNAKPIAPLPIELDATLLQAVAGGLSPNGTWAAAKTVDSPNGTW